MKRLIFLILIIQSCAANRQHYELCEDIIVINDTLVLPSQQISLDENNYLHVDELRFNTTDTILIDYYMLKRKK